METDPEVRPAGPGDVDAAAALLTASRLPLQGFRENAGNLLVISDGSGVLGCVELEIYGSAALLRSLAVAPARRGRGLGERLTREALALASRRGAREVFLLTETAEGFFPRFGFVSADRAKAPVALFASEELRSACPASAVMMRRSLA